MRLKEEMGFKLEELPIRRKLRRAVQIIEALSKKTAFFKLLKFK
jgi:peroxiredoxin